MPPLHPTELNRFATRLGALVLLACLVVAIVGLTAAAHAGPADVDHGTLEDAIPLAGVDPDESPIEAEYVEEVPDEDDPWFEATARDGSWISYVNPRDEYRSPYLGDGSGKICVTLLNEDGEVVVGEGVPNTTVSIATGDELEWHTSANPFTTEFPLTDHYDRPLDADQFGTNPDLPQGDGYLDSHCLEWHGLPKDETIEYGEAQVEGEYADWIEVVGYVQQGNQAWDSDVDPLEDAVSYEEAGGGWTYETEESHGQVVVVLQLDPPEDVSDDESGDADTHDEFDDGADNETDASGEDEPGGQTGDDETDSSDELPGFGVLVALVALAIGGHLVAVRS